MRRVLVPLATATMLLGACGDGATGSSAASTAATTTAASHTGVAEALQFSAPLVGGGTLDLRSYAGSTVVLWFWAPT